MPITWKLGDTINCTHWKVALEERNLFCRYDRDVVLMATKPSAANRCAHLETSPKIWDFFFDRTEFPSVQQKLYFGFFVCFLEQNKHMGYYNRH